MRFGGVREVGGVTVASVPAVHSNGLDPAFLEGDLAAALAASKLTAYLGPPGGYVLQFSNGLVVYLSGDTGITAEQDAVVRRFFGAELAVMNIGGIFSTGPREAAWVVNELVQPKSVIASHANEAATQDGKVRADTKTQAFIDAVKMPVHLPLSGRTMAFDDGGACVSGCLRSRRSASSLTLSRAREGRLGLGNGRAVAGDRGAPHVAHLVVTRSAGRDAWSGGCPTSPGRAHPPLVRIDELPLRRVLGQIAQEGARLRHRPADDGADMRGEIQRLASGHRVGAHQPLPHRREGDLLVGREVGEADRSREKISECSQTRSSISALVASSSAS